MRGTRRLVRTMLFCALTTGLTMACADLWAQSSFQDEIANLRSPNVGTRIDAAKALGKRSQVFGLSKLSASARIKSCPFAILKKSSPWRSRTRLPRSRACPSTATWAGWARGSCPSP